MKAKIISEKIISDKWGKYSEYSIEYTHSSGHKVLQKREIQDSGNGAAILLYNHHKRKVLLIKQFRLATLVNDHPTGVIIECVAGLVESGEEPIHAIQREVTEETGLVATNIQYLYAAYATPGAKTEKIYFFMGEYSDEHEINQYGGATSEQEDIEIIELAFDNAISMIKDGKIEDAKTIILLQYAQLHIFASV